MNFTLHNLIHIKTLANSPFLAQSSRFSKSEINFAKLSFSKSLNSFFYSHSSISKVTFLGSSFSHFLQSTIRVENENYIISDKHFSHLENDPYTMYSHSEINILIRSCSFILNFNIFYGGAISLTGKKVQLEIFSTIFENNSACFGGAIMMSSDTGQLSFESCQFSNNTAYEGHHLCAYLEKASIINCIFKYSKQGSLTFETSSIIVSGPIYITTTKTAEADQYKYITIETTNFYMNEGQIFVNYATLTYCSLFAEYDFSSNNVVQYNFFQSSSKYKFVSSCVNLHYYPETDSVSQIDATKDATCFRWQIVPSPSITLHGSIKDDEALISFVAIGLFFLISLFGTTLVALKCIVKCQSSKQEKVAIDFSSNSENSMHSISEMDETSSEYSKMD